MVRRREEGLSGGDGDGDGDGGGGGGGGGGEEALLKCSVTYQEPPQGVGDVV